MNWKTFILLCALLCGTLPPARAVEPITCKEIAMLLRNGEDPQFIINDTVRRKLLQPLSPDEEKTLLSLHATPALMNLLRDPANVASPQAAAHAAQMEQQKALASAGEIETQTRARRAAEIAWAQQQTKAQGGGNTAATGDPAARTGSGFAGKTVSLKFDAADGSPVDLARLRGKVVLIDFWATWCGPCMKEVPNVVAAYQKYHDKGFEVIGISLDKSKDAMLRVAAQKGMTWPQYFDGKAWNNEISSGFQIRQIPTMWLVNKNGLVATTEARANLDAEIAKLLAE
jgi:thiol-disulfide isomerase/thioredoxin